MLALLLALVALLAVLAIAAAAVGAASHRLATEPPKNLFDLDEAVDWVADRLPGEVTARVSYEEVREVLRWHLDFLEQRGLAAEGTPAVLGETTGAPVVVSDEDSLAWVLGRTEAGGLALEDVEVYQIIELGLSYLRAIGAVGDEVPEPEDPSASAS